MKRSPLKPGKPLQSKTALRSAAPMKASRPKTLKTRQRAVTQEEKQYWFRLATEVGCIACLLDGWFNDYVSIHHNAGRTAPGCHMQVLPLCPGHHQDGAGLPGLIAVHPWKARFEAKYGTQQELKARCDNYLNKMQIV